MFEMREKTGKYHQIKLRKKKCFGRLKNKFESYYRT